MANEQHALWSLCSRELLWEGFCSTAIPPVCGIRLPGAEAAKGCCNPLAEVMRAILSLQSSGTAPPNLRLGAACLLLAGGVSGARECTVMTWQYVFLPSQQLLCSQSAHSWHICLLFPCLLLSDLLCQASERRGNAQ